MSYISHLFPLIRICSMCELTPAVAYTLLKRYGMLFRKVLERETALPPWRELCYVYRRMEARCEIRGGRFVEGFGGELFALPNAIGLLRKQRNNSVALPTTVISATDPLNLIGIILPGERIPALHTNRILFKNGLPVTKQLNADIQYMEQVSDNQQREINNLLTRKIIRLVSFKQNLFIRIRFDEPYDTFSTYYTM
jgi:ATP-dependent helicase Lhr and Lhr-like helicase